MSRLLDPGCLAESQPWAILYFESDDPLRPFGLPQAIPRGEVVLVLEGTRNLPADRGPLQRVYWRGTTGWVEPRSLRRLSGSRSPT